MNKRYMSLALLLIATLLSACTSKQLYEVAHQNRIQACSKELPQNQQACKDRYSMTYEEYMRKKQELNKK